MAFYNVNVHVFELAEVHASMFNFKSITLPKVNDDVRDTYLSCYFYYSVLFVKEGMASFSYLPRELKSPFAVVIR